MQFTPQVKVNTTTKVVPMMECDELSREAFEQLLRENPGKVVLKFGATWCGPCQRIEAHVQQWFSRMPNSVKCIMIDIDESFDLYAAFKSKRQINGIPAILCFNSGNLSYLPDSSVAGADFDQVNTFFRQVAATSS
jgi:thiol-disulfide isomerase/thioredoxin